MWNWSWVSSSWGKKGSSELAGHRNPWTVFWLEQWDENQSAFKTLQTLYISWQTPSQLDFKTLPSLLAYFFPIIYTCIWLYRFWGGYACINPLFGRSFLFICGKLQASSSWDQVNHIQGFQPNWLYYSIPITK